MHAALQQRTATDLGGIGAPARRLLVLERVDRDQEDVADGPFSEEVAHRHGGGPVGVVLGDQDEATRLVGRGAHVVEVLRLREGRLLDDDVLAGDATLALALVLASLVDTLMPKAYAGGGPLVAFATVAGFLLSFMLSGSWTPVRDRLVRSRPQQALGSVDGGRGARVWRPGSRPLSQR